MMTIGHMLDLLNYFQMYYSKGDNLYGAYEKSIKTLCERYDGDYETIGERCRRRLGLDNIREFHNLLAKWTKNDPEELIKLLKQNSTNTVHDKIEEFFASHKFNGNGKVYKKEQARSEPVACHEGEFSIFLGSEEAKKISILSILDEKSVPDLLTEMVSETTDNRLKNWAKKIINE